jgi:CBS domain-containing protein
MTEYAREFILARELDGLRTLAPYDGISAPRLGELLARARIAFFPRGSLIFHPEVSLSEPCFWIVRDGRVRTAEALGEAAASIVAGGLFPVEVLLDRDAAWRVYTAEEDCFLWAVEGAALEDWLAEPAILRWLGLALSEAQRRLRGTVAELLRARQHSDQALAMPVRAVGATDLAYVMPDQSLQSVASVMAQRRIGSVLVGSPGSVGGIATQMDLVTRGLAAGLDHDAPVSAVMTPAPRAIDDGVSVLEAGIEMAQSKFRHLLLRNPEGQVAGLVSERDIFRAQQEGITHVFRPIDSAGGVAELVEVSRRVREFGERVFRQGMEISQFMRLVASLNDRIACRLLDILGATHGIAVPFCWLAFGSEAREEQGFVTDQDNGIVFGAPPGEAETSRSALLAFARQANDALDACGFTRCKGNIMAGNPEWCLSFEEWRERFSSWIRATTPQALLNATIFFDLRPIYGESGLAERLLDHLLGEARGNTIFLHHMAINALQVAPPVGRVSRFATGRGRANIDLKTQGSRLFVDVARIYALAHGVRSANTAQRLRVVGQRMKRSAMAIEGDVAAFRFIQSIRLRRQLDSLGDGGDPNRIDPYALDEMQQRILRESFRQAVSLQDRLKLDYRP